MYVNLRRTPADFHSMSDAYFYQVLFEIPANVLMKKFTPHAWLAGNMVFFGFVTVMQGLVKSYSGLLATRFFLGVFGKSYSR
jgi:hypothetical protein